MRILSVILVGLLVILYLRLLWFIPIIYLNDIVHEYTSIPK